MKWTRVLVRAWVILSGIWVAAVTGSYIFLVVWDEPHAHAPFAAVPVCWIGAIACVPPALLLAFWLVSVWIARRFRHDP
jgi:hypothetical protein